MFCIMYTNNHLYLLLYVIIFGGKFMFQDGVCVLFPVQSCASEVGFESSRTGDTKQ